MKLICNVSSRSLLSEMAGLGVRALAVGNEAISSRYGLSLEREEIAALSERFDCYLMLNELYLPSELALVEEWMRELSHSPLKGILFQDFAIVMLAQKLQWPVELIYAPETLNTNSMTLNDLHEMGISGAFLAREMDLETVEEIAGKTRMPLILQGHGVMYMAQSRRPLISNFARENGLSPIPQPALLKVKDSTIEAWIHEDRYGTTIQTRAELCGLDYLSRLAKANIAMLYIDTQFMESLYAIEIVNLYQEALQALEKGTFNRDIHAYRDLLARFGKGHVYDQGFFNDRTVYKIEDVRRMEDAKKGE